jgi:hypothetical protein
MHSRSDCADIHARGQEHRIQRPAGDPDEGINKTIEIAELGNDAVTVDVVQRSGALNIAFAQATNHDLMTKFTDSAKNDAYMVIAKKYSNTNPTIETFYYLLILKTTKSTEHTEKSCTALCWYEKVGYRYFFMFIYEPEVHSRLCELCG